MQFQMVGQKLIKRFLSADSINQLMLDVFTLKEWIVALSYVCYLCSLTIRDERLAVTISHCLFVHENPCTGNTLEIGR